MIGPRMQFKRCFPWLALIFVALGGCKMTATMYTWQPAQSHSGTVSTIAIAPIAGNPETAARFEQALANNRPAVAHGVHVVSSQHLQTTTEIQLVSYDGSTSDVVALDAARRAGSDLLLQGRIEREVFEIPPTTNKRRKKREPSEEFAVHWRLIDVPSGQTLDQRMLMVNRLDIEKTYPDLQSSGSGSDRVIVGMARHSWDMVAPYLKKQQTMLALPWLTPGASTIRSGNGHARKGRWDLAERAWQDAVDRHPRSKAAWHNLALSAAAREDWDLAERRLKHAESWIPLAPVESTRIWLEQQRRAYHSAYQLHPPPGGWKIPEKPSSPTSTENIRYAKPQAIQEQPWWTAIPLAKPPGWTWGQWLTQPIWF
jgi:hypothetical protein